MHLPIGTAIGEHKVFTVFDKKEDKCLPCFITARVKTDLNQKFSNFSVKSSKRSPASQDKMSKLEKNNEARDFQGRVGHGFNDVEEEA